jgi:hypothetical protein
MADQSEYRIDPGSALSAPPSSYSVTSGDAVCRLCNQHIGGDYFRINTMMACPNCAAQVRNGQPHDSHAAFSRGLLLGIGAAVVGMAVYAAVTILTGWYIGYLALGVGWLVAKAIKTGSNGLGGRRYQVAAVVLTYAAISMAAVPVGISYAIKHEKTQASAFPSPSDGNASNPSIQWRPIAGQLLIMGLASPFLNFREPFQGVLGLFILFIGLRVAWRMTANTPLDVEGPFHAVA